jgi:hypothetical protein
MRVMEPYAKPAELISPAILGLDDRHALSSPTQADCQGFTL